jgi:hypothetical protein
MALLRLVKAATVIGWQRKGFGLFWSWKIRHGKRGRLDRLGIPRFHASESRL